MFSGLRPWALLAATAPLACLAKTGGPTPGVVAPGGEHPRKPGQGAPEADACALVDVNDPGRPTLHRLNRAEYNNTVRDLLGEATHPADDFPADDHGYGFDNNADVLSFSPLLLEKYQLAAASLVTAGIGRPSWVPLDEKYGAPDVHPTFGGPFGADAWNLTTNGFIGKDVLFPADGEYQLSARAFGQQAGPDPAKMEFRLDGRTLQVFNVTVVERNPAVYSLTLRVTAGMHRFNVGFINDYYMPNDPDPNNRDRNLVVYWFAAKGPAEAPPNIHTPLRDHYFGCDAGMAGWDACATDVLSKFARSAWRRPVTSDEVGRLVALSKVAQSQGDRFEVGLGLALQAILLSPQFVFRVELDPDPSSPAPHPVTDHELATRLSYFLWSSMPDEELSRLADEGRLREPEVLTAQVRRMIRDRKSDALVDNFVGQWLLTRDLENVNPDYLVYPSFDHDLKVAMRAETHRFFRAILDEERSALELVESDFTFVNDRLASHYGLPLPGTSDFVRVQVDRDSHRGGILTQAGILTVTAFPKRTSPVRRGKLVVEQLLCQKIMDPPPGVSGLVDEMATEGTLRQRLEEHRRNPVCASCHAQMDPIGFGLENFDGIGAWRTTDAGSPIEATGTLPSGDSFEGPFALARLIKQNPKTPNCIGTRLFTYALGRGPQAADQCHIATATARATQGGTAPTLQGLIEALVQTDAFKNRRGEAN